LARRREAAWNDAEADAAATAVLGTGQHKFGDRVPGSAGRLQLRRVSGHRTIIGDTDTGGLPNS
jgi:hypothetical protein